MNAPRTRGRALPAWWGTPSARRIATVSCWALGVVVAVVVARAFMPSGLPPGIILQGAVLGGLSSLVAMGLVLLYRAFRIVNFAQGAIGALGASLAVALAQAQHWPYVACLVAGLGISLVAGALTEGLLHWRFGEAPRLIVIVVTIGLLQIFGAAQVAIPSIVGSASSISSGLHVPVSLSFTVNPLTFSVDDLVALAAVPLLGLLVWWFLWRTDLGRVQRGAADSRDQARLLGLPVRRSARAVWLLAAGLSAVGAILAAPLVQTVPGTASSPVDLLAPLAAAVLARFRSLPATVAWSLVIGVVQQAVFWSFHNSTYADVATFALIAVGLAVQRRSSRSRELDSGFGSWVAVHEVRKIPKRLAALPEVRLARRLGLIAVTTVVVVLPFVLSDAQTGPMAIALLYAVIAVSLVVLTGWSGQVSLGQFAFAGIGSLVTGALLTHAHADLLVALLLSVVVGAILACLVGLPALRLSGVDLTVITLGFAVIVSEWLLSPQYFPELNPLELARPVLFGKLSLSSPTTFYEVCLGALIVALVLARNLRRSRTGRAMLAVRDSPSDAAGFGIEPWRQRLTAFAFAGALSGLAGGLYVVAVGGTGYGGIDPTLSVTVFSMAVVGGMGSLTGALLGAAYIWSVVTFLPAGWSLLASGAGLLVLLAFLPEGLSGVLFRIRDRVAQQIATRHGIDIAWWHPATTFGDVDGIGAADPSAVATDGTADIPVEPLEGGGLELVDLHVSYGRQHVLRGVSLEVDRGGTLALVGTNGAGKSTLLRAVSGLEKSRNGSIFWNGADISTWGPAERVDAGIVTVLGGRGIFPSLTVAENLRLAGLTLRRRQRPDALPRVEDEIHELFPVLQNRLGVPAGQLSGGERQMLALAQALMCDPRMLLIDELSLGLAPLVVTELVAKLKVLEERGVSMVVVDQSLAVAVSLTDHVVFLERGKVRFTGATNDLVQRTDLVRSVFLARETRGGRSAVEAEVAGSENPPPAKQSGGGTIDVEALRADEMSKRFGGVAALTDVELRVGQGEIIGLIGCNGAGKTTLLDLCSGFERPDRGSVTLRGKEVTNWSPARRAREGLGRVFQDTWLFPSMTVEEVVGVARDRHIAIRDALLCSLWTYDAARSEHQAETSVDDLLHDLTLADLAEAPVSSLSTGLRRIVALACAVAFEPHVLLMDEPSSGLAESEARELTPMLRRLRDRTGTSLVVIDHDLTMVEGVADRLAFLEAGFLTIDGEPQAVLSDPHVVASYVGTEYLGA